VLGRWVAVADPKGEYVGLADALGLPVVSLHPGGTARINPLDRGAEALAEGLDELARRQAGMVAALVATVLRRDLSPVEDAALGWGIEHLARQRRHQPTLADVAALLAEPTDDMARRASTTAAQLSRSVDAARYALGKLLD